MAVNSDDLMEVAEMILDDEGQVEVSVKIDDGDTRGAQVYLLGAIDRLIQESADGTEALAALITHIGLSAADVEQIRSQHSSPDLWS